ncbi:MAG TPA: DUF5719 family protein [Acidobacteriota bacterium]|nr:DUF5719 family protein [Acidobacteriota bacterium]
MRTFGFVLLVWSLCSLLGAQTDATAVLALTDNRKSYPGEEIPRYEKLEITFAVNTSATNYFLPYASQAPAGIQAGTGISVDAIFTAPDGALYSQPAFHYQEFDHQVKSKCDWLYPTDNYMWKVRFSPNQPGVWSYRIVVQDASGVRESDTRTFNVVESSSHGFVRVSEKDPRYFEFDDGTYFPGLGYNMNYNHVSWKNPVVDNEHNFRVMGENGIQLVRIWLSQWAIYGSAWNPWRSHVKNGYFPNESLSLEEKHPHSDLSFKISYPENPCILWGWGTHQLPVKRNKTYRLHVRYKAVNMGTARHPNKPHGFVVKLSGWAWPEEKGRRITEPGVGTVVTPHVSGNSHGWQVLEGSFNAGDNDFLDYLYLVLENIAGGTVYVDYISVREELASGGYGPNIVPKPSPNVHYYVDQRNAYAFDRVLDLAHANGVYLRPVILDKMDWVFRHIDLSENWIPNQSSCWDENPHNDPSTCPKGAVWFFGNGRQEHKTRWLQKAWWRYLQARWGYSPNIHSWELLNEGDPGDKNHWALADEFGQFMHSEVFGVPVKDGERFAIDHPNDHLVSTSFYLYFPVLFYRNTSGEHGNVDFADIHRYIRFGEEGFDDLALETSQLSMSLRSLVTNKPIVRGETGLRDVPEGFITDSGLWLHNLIWASINPGGMIDSYFFEDRHIYPKDKKGRYLYDHRPEYGNFYRFISTIPLNNGHYQDADPEISNPALRAWGQKDLTNGNAHLWIQNREYTWRKVVNKTPDPESGTVILHGFKPGASFLIEWWDTSQGAVSGRETQRADSSGRISLSVTRLATDVAVKISQTANRPPVVNAGADQTVAPGAKVILTGSVFDPDGDPVTYIPWEQISGPNVFLSKVGATASFTAPSVNSDTELVFRFGARDSQEAIDADTVRVLVNAPGFIKVSAGADQQVLAGSMVTLNGSRIDPGNGELLSFQWKQVAGPPVVLLESDTPTPRFHAPKGLPLAEFAFRLTVQDKYGNQASDECRVTALKAADLFFPSDLHHSGRDLESAFVGVAVFNSSPEPSTVEFVGVGEAGEAGTLASSVLSATSQDAFLTASLPGSGSYQAILARDQNDSLQGFFLVGDGRPDKLDGVGNLMAPSKSLFLPIVRGEHWNNTVLFISNSETQPAVVSVEVVGYDGRVTAKRDIQLDPRLSRRIALSDLFPANSLARECYIHLASDVPISGLAILAGKLDFSSVCGQAPQGTSMLWLPHFVFGRNGEDTELRFINAQETALEARLLIYDDSATLLTARLLTIPGKGLVINRVSELLTPAGIPPEASLASGYITVEVFTEESSLIGAAVFTSTLGKARSILPFWRQPQNETLYLQVAQSSEDGVFTGLAIMNPNDQTVSVTVEVFDQNGRVTGRKNLFIDAGRRVVDLLDGVHFFGPSFRQMKGYMRVTGDRPIVSFAMFGDGQTQFLSAVEGQPALQ